MPCFCRGLAEKGMARSRARRPGNGLQAPFGSSSDRAGDQPSVAAPQSPVAPTEAAGPGVPVINPSGIVVGPGQRPAGLSGARARKMEATCSIAPRAMNERIKSVVSIALFLCWPGFVAFSSFTGAWPVCSGSASEPAESRAGPESASLSLEPMPRRIHSHLRCQRKDCCT